MGERMESPVGVLEPIKLSSYKKNDSGNEGLTWLITEKDIAQDNTGEPEENTVENITIDTQEDF